MKRRAWFEFLMAFLWIVYAVVVFLNPDKDYHVVCIVNSLTLSAMCALFGLMFCEDGEHDQR